jgi:hypothetical protein
MTGMMMERSAMGMTGMTAPGMPAVMPGMMGSPSNWMMVPRCTIKFEKCQGGLKINCVCDDAMARSMMQNLCTALQGGMCSCCMTLNGTTVCSCNLTMGLCRCDMTDKGVCVTCTSGDPKCCEMLQSCCDCLACLCKDGCTCCLMMNNTPVCCGC